MLWGEASFFADGAPWVSLAFAVVLLAFGLTRAPTLHRSVRLYAGTVAVALLALAVITLTNPALGPESLSFVGLVLVEWAAVLLVLGAGSAIAGRRLVVR